MSIETNHCRVCNALSQGDSPFQLGDWLVLATATHAATIAELPIAEQAALMRMLGGALVKRAIKTPFELIQIDGHVALATRQELGPRMDAPKLIVGGADPLFEHLVAHIDRANEVDIAVAFALQSGVTLLRPHLEDLLARGGRLRIVVGDYLDVTEPSALASLLDLEGSVQRWVYQTDGSSFHPKAWLFRAGEATGHVIVGSSNLTATALTHGVEWNLRSAGDLESWGTVAEAFEQLLQSPYLKPLTSDWIDAYARRRKSAPQLEITRRLVAEEPSPPIPEPHDLQRAALEALRNTRAEGRGAGLVVLATGLGKTWLAAFDSVNFRRVLFVAHRDEILSQAINTFRAIRPEDRFARYDGSRRETGDVVFASIQTLGKASHLALHRPDHFDYIVIDEFHHAAAPTYRRLINHFRPKFLLGLTATPERTDGGDLLDLCEDNLVFQCDLAEGIAEGLLAPFRYFGVPDDINYANIPWRGGQFDEAELTRALATQARADNALEQFRQRAQGPAIGFCASKAHARFMADHFRNAGLRAVAVYSGQDSAPRTTSLEALARGDLDILFAVDMFNEGVDVPAIGTVMMLRPTESTIIFLQQLGRGLRKADGKQALQVIDYIGNHRSFLTKARALLGAGPGDRSLLIRLEEVERGQAELPPGCEVTYELRALDLLKSLLRSRREHSALEAYYHGFRAKHARRPVAAEIAAAGFDPASNGHGGWFEFVRDMGDPVPIESLIAHGHLLRRLGGRREPSPSELALAMALVRMGPKGASEKALIDVAEAVAAPFRHEWRPSAPLLRTEIDVWISAGLIRREGSNLRLAREDGTGRLSGLIEEIVNWRQAALLGAPERQTTVEQAATAVELGPQLWQEYPRDQIPQLFGEKFSPGNWNSGIVRVPQGLVLLVTLDKSAHSMGQHYKDHFEAADLFHWQSQNQTQRVGGHGQILSGRVAGKRVFLFVRGEKLRNGKAAPFIYCGMPRFLSWEGEAPITIHWRLLEPVPTHLHRAFAIQGV